MVAFWQTPNLYLELLGSRFDRSEIILERSEIILERSEIILERSEVVFDRLETVFDRLEVVFDRLETVFDRLEVVFDRLETVFDRLEVVFDRLETVFDRSEIILEWKSFLVDEIPITSPGFRSSTALLTLTQPLIQIFVDRPSTIKRCPSAASQLNFRVETSEVFKTSEV